MRVTILLLIIAAHASAQTDAGKLLAQGLQSALAGLAPVPEQDQAAVLKTTAELLAKHVTFRPDGDASAFYTESGRQPVEWKRLVVRSITALSVTEADRLNGITKRYLVAFGCDAHRTWDSKTNRWRDWLPIGNVTFPPAIYLEWKNGKWAPAEASRLKFFVPVPGPSTVDPKPTAKSDGLPPGMTRGR